MKIDKILGNIIRIPIYLLLIIGTPIIYILGLGLTLSFKDTNDLILNIFLLGETK